MEIFLKAERDEGLSNEELEAAVERTLKEAGGPLRRVLIIPPDFTRFHSNGGFLTNRCYHILEKTGCRADILPALGTHAAMSREQFSAMYGDIPYERMIVHDWRRDVEYLGDVPAITWKRSPRGSGRSLCAPRSTEGCWIPAMT